MWPAHSLWRSHLEGSLGVIAAAGVGGEGGGPDLPRVNQQVDANGASGFFQAPHQCQTRLSGLHPEGTRLTAATATVHIFP